MYKIICIHYLDDIIDIRKYMNKLNKCRTHVMRDIEIYKHKKVQIIENAKAINKKESGGKKITRGGKEIWV